MNNRELFSKLEQHSAPRGLSAMVLARARRRAAIIMWGSISCSIVALVALITYVLHWLNFTIPVFDPFVVAISVSVVLLLGFEVLLSQYFKRKFTS